MTNATETAPDYSAIHAATEALVLKAVLAERQGRYLAAAPLFDQIDAMYQKAGVATDTYWNMAERCRAFAAGKTYPAKGRKRPVAK